MSQMQTVGFIGLGGMGRGLVKNMALKGVDVRVMDRRPEAVADVAQFGAKPADSLEALRRDCPVIMVCINTAEDTEKLVLGPGGLCDLDGPTTSCWWTTPHRTPALSNGCQRHWRNVVSPMPKPR
jgi:3-hydroxyisobutyrate dehydrogenase-like beta-hydroxyacid dehydrogenase